MASSLLEKIISGRESSSFLLFECSLGLPSLLWSSLLEAISDNRPCTLLVSSHRTRRLLASLPSPPSSLLVLYMAELSAPNSLCDLDLDLLFPDCPRQVFIDSLDLLLFSSPSAHSVARWCLRLRNDPRCNGLVACHHCDAHAEESSALLALYASSLVRSVTWSKDGLQCSVRHRKTTGRLERSTELVQLSPELRMTSCRTVGAAQRAERPLQTADKDAGDFESLTFDLRLSVEEKAERSRVRLPYVLSYEEKEAVGGGGSGGGGAIHYEADEFDDFDEEDPDDDLNI